MSNAASERGNGRGEEEDPRRELVEQLLQYKMYKYMAYELKDRQTDADMILYKDPTIPEEVKEYAEPVDLDELLGDLTLKKLNEIFKEVMKRQVDKIDPVRSKFGKIEKEKSPYQTSLYIYTNTCIHIISSPSDSYSRSKRARCIL